MTELSDELLVAYVDGQLARTQSKAVEKVLKQDEVIARRVEALKEAHARFESAFEAILAGEMHEITLRADPYVRTTEPAPQPVKGKSMTSLVLVGILAALAGYSVPLVLPELTPERYVLPKETARMTSNWQDDVARTQALLTRSSLEVGLESQGNRDLIAFELAQAVGPTLKVPNLDPQGLKLVRGQLLHYSGKPLAQILYLGSRGAPIALYAMPTEQKSDPEFSVIGDIGMVAWSEEGVSYLLAADADEDLLMRTAEKIRHEPQEEIPPPPPPGVAQPAPPPPAASDTTSSLPNPAVPPSPSPMLEVTPPPDVAAPASPSPATLPN
jgi:anti-sigma factor RsiW